MTAHRVRPLPRNMATGRSPWLSGPPTAGRYVEPVATKRSFSDRDASAVRASMHACMGAATTRLYIEETVTRVARPASRTTDQLYSSCFVSLCRAGLWARWAIGRVLACLLAPVSDASACPCLVVPSRLMHGREAAMRRHTACVLTAATV